MSLNGISMDAVVAPINQSLNQVEQDLRAQIQSMGNNPSTADLLIMQQQLQKWTMLIQLQSTVVKEFGDAMKGVIQKAS